MNDTPPDVDDLYRSMLLRLSPEERLRMACRMFSAARVLVGAGIATSSGSQVRRSMLLRFYSQDMPDDRFRELAVHAIEGWSRR